MKSCHRNRTQEQAGATTGGRNGEGDRGQGKGRREHSGDVQGAGEGHGGNKRERGVSSLKGTR